MSDFDRALGRELKALLPLARHLAKDFADADDLIQNVAVRALVARNSGHYEETGRLRPWLLTILYNQFKRLLRDRWRHPTEPIDLLFEEYHPVMMPAGEWAVALADARAAFE